MTGYESNLPVFLGEPKMVDLLQRQTSPPGACDLAVIPGYTQCMKTAISVPDEIFNQVGSRAAELGISRSEFFARAARQSLDQPTDASPTQKLDRAIDAEGDAVPSLAPVYAGRAFLAAVDDEW